MQPIEETPVFILCGGLGTRLKEETQFRPKPMVTIGDYPILWHIMRWYRKFGFRRFILCLGFKGEMIKSYFLNYSSLRSDFTVDLKSSEVNIHSVEHDQDWLVTLVDTGEECMTGGRVARAAESYLGNCDHFAVTYGDGLTNADLADEFTFHQKHQKLGTVLGVNPPSRFGEIKIEGSQVTQFAEKPTFKEKWINGGYFFFRREFIDRYLSKDPSCILEQSPLVNLADDRELNLYRHRGFWSCMDTQRDREQLNQLWSLGEAPWVPTLPFCNIQSTEESCCYV